MKRMILVTLLSAALLAPLAQARTTRMVEHAQVSFVAPADAAKVHDAIVEVGKTHGWVASDEAPGKLTLSNTIRGTFKVVVNVSYTSTGMQVDYVSSENLEYVVKHGGPYIHPKYNKWVDLLMQETKTKLAS